jgi:hypothetical protein
VTAVLPAISAEGTVAVICVALSMEKLVADVRPNLT